MAIRTADVIMPGNDNAFETGRRGQISSIADLDESYRSLLEKNVTATLATIKRNGLPQLTPIWVAHDGTHILVNTMKGASRTGTRGSGRTWRSSASIRRIRTTGWPSTHGRRRAPWPLH
jgi:pyridoxamine 5'-phosphate oxidase-like protein